jgi:hypothetical protein
VFLATSPVRPASPALVAPVHHAPRDTAPQTTSGVRSARAAQVRASTLVVVIVVSDVGVLRRLSSNGARRDRAI